MASPFNVFRKHQKVIIVAAGVLCMFVFVIGDVLFQLVPTGAGGSGRNDADAPAVRWNDGELTRLELASLEMRRNILSNFLNTAMQTGIARTGGTTSPNVRPLSVMRNQQRSEQETVLRHLVAEKAKDAGMVVSDEAINHYLSQLTQGQVSSEELRASVARLQADGRRVGMNYIFEAIRDEMLAEAYLDSYSPSLQTVTPAQKWEDWRKLNDRVVIESLAVPVGNFVDQVAEPTDDELTAFYELYKNRAPSPVLVEPFTELPSPDPAFAVPRKFEVHYIEADYETVAEHLESEVTDEEIQQHYEENKDPQYLRPQLDLGIDGIGTTQPPIDGLPPEVGQPSSADPNNESSATDPNSEPSLSDPTDDASQAAPQGANPFTPPGADEADSDEAPEPADETQGSHLYKPLDEATQYVAFLQDNADSPPLGEDLLDADLQDADEPPGANPIPEEIVEENELVLPDSEIATADGADTTGIDNLDGMPPEPDETPQAAYYPLEMVRDEIRRDIARDRVEQKLQITLALIQSDLLTAYKDYEERRIDAEIKEQDLDEVAPPKIDLEQMVQRYGIGLVAKQTTLLSQIELRETPVGKSEHKERARPYWAFVVEQPLYEPAWTVGFPDFTEEIVGGMSQYIVLKVDDTLEGDVPDLADIRDEVVRSFKRVKARDEAMAEAERIAEQAEGAATSLQEQFAESDQYEPVESDPFSWYQKQFDQRFHLGKPYGVDHAGPEFHETVFSLEPGEFAAAWNHDKSIAYVVRLVRHDQSEDALRTRYLIEGQRPDLFREQGMLNVMHGSEFLRALQTSILNEAGVDWGPFE